MQRSMQKRAAPRTEKHRRHRVMQQTLRNINLHVPSRCRAWFRRSRFMPARMCRPATCSCSIEAMKMETALYAERDGKIAGVLIHAGSQIDAKDLLVVYEG